MKVKKAARIYGVPTQTLRDRVLNKIEIDANMGNATLFTEQEEEQLVNHIETLSKLGYGMNRAQLAVKLGRKSKGEKMSNKWYYDFLKRWESRLKIIRPRSLESNRAKSLTQEAVDTYYENLNDIMEKYNLKDKPHLIYNVDETRLQSTHRPPAVITSRNSSAT